MDQTDVDIGTQVRDLVDSLSPRTAHQYKSYNAKYVQWLRGRKIIGSDAEASVLYRELPLSAHLVHWFLLDTLILESGHGQGGGGDKRGDKRGDEDGDDDKDDFKIATLKKMVSSLKFLNKLCAIHGNSSKIDDKYVENVTKLHSHWISLNKDDLLPLVKVSINLWNDYTPSLAEKFFKSCFEKTRFIVDFQLRFISKLSYDQRSKIKLSQLKPGADNRSISFDQKTWSSLQVYLPDSHPRVKSHMPIVLSSRSCPFLCPLTSLATYLYLRFYGIKTMTKGDGFPNLLEERSSHKDTWLDLPLIRGKSLLDYPRDETLSNYYSSVFRYCQLPYKRRDFFTKPSLQFPTWSESDFSGFFDDYYNKSVNQKDAAAFADHVPVDFKQIMNFKSSGSYSNETRHTDLPKGLLVQIFPEIESYRRQWDSLSIESQNFIKLLEILRNHFLSNLPIIFQFFPNHDLFKDPIFQNTDFQSYFHDIIGKKKIKDEYVDSLPGFVSINEDCLKSLLIESSTTVTNNAKTNDNLSIVDLSSSANDLMNKTFQFAQYQTLTNFRILISLLTNIFDRLEMKKSSREFMIHQLGLVQDTINEKINVSKPIDVDNFVKEEEDQKQVELKNVDDSTDHTDKKGRSKRNTHGLLAIEDEFSEEADIDDDDDNDNDNQDMQQELKFMINELVGERVRSTVKQQMEEWETKIKKMVDAAVESKISAVVKRNLNEFEDDNEDSLSKRQRLSITPSITNNESTPNYPVPEDNSKHFEMNPHLESVESVILEWFTPNPDMNNECVHHMNKNHSKSWRSSFEKLYKERKVVVEFYIYLVNDRAYDRYKAVDICESFKRKTNDGTLRSLAQYLKEWKKNHSNSFAGGILEEN